MKRGFTLVELSIVLVILGLVTGGILLGQNLIRAAELKTIATDKDRFIQAISVFQEQYYGLPGDIPHATDLWGAADSSAPGGECGSPVTDEGTGAQTCNGNGDGQIFNNTTWFESYLFWEHLANAELIDGNYTGVRATTTNPSIAPGVNAPKGSLAAGAWMAQQGVDAGNVSWFTGRYQTVLEFGASINNTWVSNPILTPEETWNIDTKTDDGKPGLGNVMTFKNTSPTYTCASTDDPATAEYILSDDSEQCHIIFKTGF